jgi:hypothetical protein
LRIRSFSCFIDTFYLQCAVMTAEVACRIISSGEENYVSSRQERIGASVAITIHVISRVLSHALLLPALIRRLKFRVQRSNSDRGTPQPSSTIPSGHLGRSGSGTTHSVPAQAPPEGGLRCLVQLFVFPSFVFVLDDYEFLMA